MKRKNAHFFEQELDKLDRWADDRRSSLEFALKDIQRDISAKKKEAKLADSLEAKLDVQREIKALERQRTTLRKELFDAADKIDREKDILLDQVEAQLKHSVESKQLFQFRWTVR